ncbi:MAG: hypothetical protein IT377_12840 [Polyangiaceae bacterium]|nr:hypothetical protein [Polyangiaceae bacterium]
MRIWMMLVCLPLATACKKEAAATTGTPSASATGVAAPSKLGGQLLGRWNDAEDGTLAWEFLAGGKCKLFGNMDCQYELGTETGSVLRLRYKATDSWEDVEVTFDGTEKASWKNLTETQADPDTAPTKLVRAK